MADEDKPDVTPVKATSVPLRELPPVDKRPKPVEHGDGTKTVTQYLKNADGTFTPFRVTLQPMKRGE